MRDYHRLVVWQKAHALTLDVRRAARSFHRAGCTTLKSQLLRAAESIPSNIVEGCFASTPTEFARFLDISIKSTGEVEYQLELARDYGVLSHRLWQPLAAKTVEIRRMLVVFRQKVRRT